MINFGTLQNGRYQVVRHLGAGGMQDVYVAHDSLLERDVALKTPKNKHALKRFESSAQLSARINNPNVARTLDYFTEGGRQFLIEELASGGDLADYRSLFDSLDAHIVAHILCGLARGVAAAHSADVIHRDIKPSNLLVGMSNGLPLVKFSDFGIAILAESEIREAVETGNDTSSSTFLGAIPYMAPEMLKKDRESSMAADIWSIGAVAYELLSGALPFGGGVEALDRIRSSEALSRPGKIDKNAQMAPLAEEIFKIISSCMHRVAAKRPSAEDLVLMSSRLCYSDGSRRDGVVDIRKASSGVGFGFIQAEDGNTVFYHDASVVGKLPRVGDRVSFACYTGTPRPRAFPVLRYKTNA